MNTKSPLIHFCCIAFFFIMFILPVQAGQVTMASFDFDDDSYDEIIRTDEENGKTYIRVYKKLDNSYFYGPFQEFVVPGRLVQVPEIQDINKDGQMDYFFATGSDMGVLYFDIIQQRFQRTNQFDFNAVDAARGSDAQGSVSSEQSRLSDIQESLETTKEADYELEQVKEILASDEEPAGISSFGHTVDTLNTSPSGASDRTRPEPVGTRDTARDRIIFNDSASRNVI